MVLRLIAGPRLCAWPYETMALDSQEMVEEADRNNDGVVDKEEFFRVMRKRADDPLDDLDSDSDF